MQNALALTTIEEIDKDTWIIQADDGTLFYWQTTSPHRLYVKWQGKEIDAELPNSVINCDGACGNSVYFTSNRKVYTATFNPTEGIAVSYVRDQRLDEKSRWEFYSRVRDGKKYVYRLSDDFNDEHGINVSDEELKGLYLRRLHRGKVIYFSINSEASIPSARKMKDNAFVVTARDLYPLDARDSSPFLYMADRQKLFTLDTRTMEFLPVLHSGDHAISYIVGAYDGVIHFVCSKSESSSSFMKAQFPCGYFENLRISNVIQFGTDAPLRKYTEIMHLLKEIRERNSKIEVAAKKNEAIYAEMKDTIIQQQKAITELTEENGQLRSVEKDNDKLNSSNLQLKKEISDLMRENYCIQRVNEDETAQLKKTIAELRAELADLKAERWNKFEIDSEEEYEDTGETVNDLKDVIARLRQMEKSQKMDKTIGSSIRKEPIDAEIDSSPPPHFTQTSPPPKPPRTFIEDVSLSNFPHELHIPAHFYHKE